MFSALKASYFSALHVFPAQLKATHFYMATKGKINNIHPQAKQEKHTWNIQSSTWLFVHYFPVEKVDIGSYHMCSSWQEQY